MPAPTPRPAGRPKAPLAPPASVVTRRVRRVIDEAHLGNLTEAAQHTRLPYGTVRDLYLGRTRNPGLQTIAALAGAYGLSPGWFADPAADDSPLIAVESYLPPDPDYARRGRGRRIRIPLAAWPFARLLLRLEASLVRLPASAGRPIIAGLTDRDDVRTALTEFLLSPLMRAQDEGWVRLHGVEPPYRRRRPSDTSGRWVETLRALGAFWELALGALLERLERNPTR